MTPDWNNKKLKTFIKDTLGCGCPDKVFEKIDVEAFRANGYTQELTRIVVGDTLLIYIARPAELENVEDNIEIIGTTGKTDRDTHQYNRFRLVVATAENHPLAGNISDQFISAFGSDEKMHIHFVSDKLVEEL